MVRVWGLPAVTTEADLTELLEAQGLNHAVRSVVLDPRQTTAAGKVALVRFEPPPLPEAGAAAAPGGSGQAVLGADVTKVAEGIIAALRAKAPVVHGAKVNVEKTGAEVGWAASVACVCGKAVEVEQDDCW